MTTRRLQMTTGEAVTVKQGFGAAISQLEIALPEVGTSLRASGKLMLGSSLEDTWITANIFSSQKIHNPPGNLISYMYKP